MANLLCVSLHHSLGGRPLWLVVVGNRKCVAVIGAGGGYERAHRPPE
jgi:hypothetical protein